MKKNIKNISKIFFVTIFLFSIFKVINVLAEDVDFKVTKVEIKEKSEGVKVNKFSYDGGEVTNNIIFTNKDDYIKYNITIKNTSDNEYIIKSVTDNNDSKYLEYKYSDLLNAKLSKGEEKTFELIILYKNESNSINISTHKVKLSLTYKDKNDIGEETIILNNNIQNNSSSKSPKTGDNIYFYFALEIISTIGLGLTIMNKKRISKAVMFLGIITLTIIPFAVKAESGNLIITFDNNIKAYEVIVDFDTDGGSKIDSLKIASDSKIEKPTDPTRKDYMFENWYLDKEHKEIFDFENARINKNITLYANWVYKPFPTVFSQKGECIFNGLSPITGVDCSKYVGQHYIDTKISLYNEENYNKDYEIGFDIVSYNPDEQISSISTILNSKYENKEEGYPGLVFRRNNNKDLELSQITSGKADRIFKKYESVKKVKIVRKDNKYYFSLNDGFFKLLQDSSDIEDKFDTSTWFGASQDIDGNAMREFTGKLSNMYVKLGKYYSDYYMVSLETNGGEIQDKDIKRKGFEKIGELSTPIKENSLFLGWYTEDGEKVNGSELISGDITLYAKWEDNKYAASMNGNYYNTVQEAINNATNEKCVIKIYKDIKEQFTVPKDKNIVIDAGNYTITSVGKSKKDNVIHNYGTLELRNGIYTSEAEAGIINNYDGAYLIVNGARIVATGKRQTLYNYSGKVDIINNSYFSAKSEITSNNQRGTVESLGGELNIESATIVSTSENTYAVSVTGGILNIGQKDDKYDNTSVVITGGQLGIYSTIKYSIYDGVIKGRNQAVNNENYILNTENNSEKLNSTEVIDGEEYKVLSYKMN